MLNCYYSNSLKGFQEQSTDSIIGKLSIASEFNSQREQIQAWKIQIELLKNALTAIEGNIFLEFSIPRLGKRVDALLLVNSVVLILEFKIHSNRYYTQDINQTWDYALDLKHFHKPSHNALIIPILISTDAPDFENEIKFTSHQDNLAIPLRANRSNLKSVIDMAMNSCNLSHVIDPQTFLNGSYSPTPTIVEVAVALYNQHSVENITRSDSEAKNLLRTTLKIKELIRNAQASQSKIIAFVTGVPGAGKTLVGLKVATDQLSESSNTAGVYLSGNKPLVDVLQEALARDRVSQQLSLGNKVTKSSVRQSVKTFIQIIHHYRDAYINDSSAPYDHVAIFDEAQRAWNKEQTLNFMRKRKSLSDFQYSEPEFLISCLDRHKDWAVIICLVGGGQEINVGEAGISEWLKAIENRFDKWKVYISPNLTDSEYSAESSIRKLKEKGKVNYDEELHLSVSMRSFRAEALASFIKNMLDLKTDVAIDILSKISLHYPIYITRDLEQAKAWLKEKARGSERYGIMVSSKAQRLKPMAIDVKSPMNPVHWFLANKDDVRSSFYLEDVATEFHVQGLEVDWSCVVWDADLRFDVKGWRTYSFQNSGWRNVKAADRKQYLINAYRVLLTRARLGMIIVVPEGSAVDHTRKSEYYDSTFNYLKDLGINIL